MTKPIPPYVQHYADEARDKLGRDITITTRTSRCWEISVEDNGIRATAVIKADPKGRHRQTGGTLTVNGQDRPTVSFEDLRTLLDGGKPGAEPTPLPEPVDPETAPVFIRQQLEQVRSALGPDADAVATVGRHSTGWVLAIDAVGKDSHLRIFFHQRGVRWAQWNPHGPSLEVIVQGIDYTAEVDGRLDEALSLLGGAQSAPDRPGTLGQPQDAKANNSVLVRRSTVIRT